jgi:hypothetical protein
MQTENKETIEIEGKKYIIEDLTDKQRYYLAQIKECQNKSNMFKMQIDQMDMAAKSFTNNLIEDLKEKPEEEKE